MYHYDVKVDSTVCWLQNNDAISVQNGSPSWEINSEWRRVRKMESNPIVLATAALTVIALGNARGEKLSRQANQQNVK